MTAEPRRRRGRCSQAQAQCRGWWPGRPRAGPRAASGGHSQGYCDGATMTVVCGALAPARGGVGLGPGAGVRRSPARCSESSSARWHT
eukprot:2451251-Rhodomonas_salina.1